MAWVTLDDNTSRCRLGSRRTIYRSSRTVHRAPLTCDDWDCDECGVQAATLALADLAAATRAEPAIYISTVPSTTDAERKAFNTAVSRAPGGGAMRVQRSDGTVVVLANGVLGRTSGGQWVTTLEARIYASQAALSLPGVERCDWSGRWRVTHLAAARERQRERPVFNRTVYDARFDEVWEAVADRAEERWGVKPKRDFIDGQIDLDEFAAMLHDALERREEDIHCEPSDDPGGAVTEHPSEPPRSLSPITQQ